MSIPTDPTGQFYAASDDAIAGYAAQFKVGDGASPENFEAIAIVTKITPGAQSSTDVKTTHLRSLNRHEEHRAGMRDTSVFNIEGTYVGSAAVSHATAGGGSGAFAAGGLPALAAAGTNHNFLITDVNDATIMSLRGYIATFSIGEINKDGVIPYTLTIQPTQAPVLQ